MSDAHLNVVFLSGFATRDPILRHKTSGQVKAEFSFEVNRPFFRATGEAVSDLFLVDAWEDIGQWTMDNVKSGDNLIIVGTLNKESHSTRGGREHLTIVKAKYIGHVDETTFGGRIDTEALKGDDWDHSLVLDIVSFVQEMLGDSPAAADDVDDMQVSS
jgi:single-stranded DNA-binding protein